jgi:hypothetical protein
MEEVIDKLRSELEALRQSEEFLDTMEIRSDVKFDDPGLVVHGEYPYMFVAPVSDEPKSETAGRAGYEVRVYNIQVGLVVDASEFFDPMANEVPASRELVRAGTVLRRHLRRLAKRNLDGLARTVKITGINYVPDLRQDVFVKAAIMSVLVEIQDPNEE